MKKAGDILKEMGFRPEGSDSVKEAFVRHLIKAATGVVVAPGPHERQTLAAKRLHISGKTAQLSFDFDQEAKTTPITQPKDVKKTS